MTDGLEYLGRARVQGLTLLVLAFVVGALAGAAADRLLTRPAPAPPPPRERDGRPRLPRVLEEMSLTATQRATIDSILASGKPRNEAIMNSVLPRFRAVSDSLRAAIRSVLTPEQARAFDAYVRENQPARMSPPPADGGADVRDGAPPRERPGPGRPPRDDRGERKPPPRPDDREGDRPPPPSGGSAPGESPTRAG